MIKKTGLLISIIILLIVCTCFSQPEIVFVSPTPNNETVITDYAYINVTLTESADWVYLEWNLTNESMQGSGTEWYLNKTDLDNGNYTFKIYANNSQNMNVSEDRWVWINATRYLDVNLTLPPTDSTIIVLQNVTYMINASVRCRGGFCGNVNGTLRYNISDTVDTPISNTEGGTPFYVHESPYPSNATKDCGIMLKNQECTLSWIVNTTGENNTQWAVDVLFNSTVEGSENNTNDAKFSIFLCSIDFTLQWERLTFGSVDPSRKENPAVGNDDEIYNISVNPGSCPLDFYIRGTDLENSTLGTTIGIGNITWSNTSNIYSTSLKMEKIDSVVSINVSENTNVTTWYWINTPPVYAGNYSGYFTITGVRNGESP